MDRSLLAPGLLLALLALSSPARAQRPGAPGRPAVALGGGPAIEVPRRPFPQHNIYPGVRVVPDHLGRAERDAAVVTLFRAWKRRYLVSAGVDPNGEPRYRVRAGRALADPTVSEGQGYGMVLCAFLAGAEPGARRLFDGLLEFALDHPSTVDGRLMDWFVNADESPDTNGDDSAFDGDADIAYALLLAEVQWGNGGRFDYGLLARDRLEGLLASAVGPTSHLPLLGDWVDPLGVPYSQWTPRTSDLMPGHFRAFEAALGDGRWRDVRLASQSLVDAVQASHSPATGLLPDFLVPTSGSGLPLKPAGAGFLEGPFDGDDYYNACRDPWRIGVDALLSADPVSVAQARAIGTWIRSKSGGDPFAIAAGYHLWGGALPGSNYFTNAFAAPFAVATMLDPSAQDFVNALFDEAAASDEDYYEDSLALLSLIVLTENWWSP